jgi:2-polyprenyl-6-methoxyphenol hydroxylase-like FAD-dependent oxidoreductase
MALSLSRLGVNYRIIDRLAQPSTASRAKGIQPRSLEILDDLGVIEPILELGRVKMPMRFHDSSGAIVDRPTISVRASDKFASPYPELRWIGQFSIENAMRERLAELGGPPVEFGVEAVELHQDETGVTVSVETPSGSERVHAQFVIGADGAHSAIRRFIGVEMEGVTIDDEPWYFGDVIAPDLDRGFMHIWTSESGMVGLTPLPGSDLWQFQLALPKGSVPETPSLELYQRLLDERAGVGVVRITDASWLSAPHGYNARVADRYRVDRVFLAGDAAHSHSAAGGQGMNTGIQDSYNLAWKVATILRGADDHMLNTYEAERKPVAEAVLADSSAKMGRTTAAATKSSEEGLGDALNSIADDVTTGLPIFYPDSFLSFSGTAVNDDSIVPGDRVPNATGLVTESGEVELFDLLRGTHWTLVVYGYDGQLWLADRPSDHLHVYRIGSGADDVVDSLGSFRSLFNARPGEIFFVRPDGYLAVRVSAEEEGAFLAHVGQFRQKYQTGDVEQTENASA